MSQRLATIRVFDPACGSGNFLVIAYKEMRAIEAAIVERLGGEASLKLDERRSVIPLSNFYGIEIKGFAAEIARLALLIAEFQADCLYLSQQEARAMVLPLHKTGQITVGNALRVDWLEVCPPVRVAAGAEQDLGGPTGRLALEANGLDNGTEAETYIASNPPYKGRNKQSPDQKDDLAIAFSGVSEAHKSLDYVSGWIIKAALYSLRTPSRIGLVSTNSICQGEQVGLLWPSVLDLGLKIYFAHRSFTWANLAAAKAGVTVVVIGLANVVSGKAKIFESDEVREAANISPYLVPGANVIVSQARRTISDQLDLMYLGSMPKDGGYLLSHRDDAKALKQDYGVPERFIREFWGAEEAVNNDPRFCLWIDDKDLDEARSYSVIDLRLNGVTATRLASPTPSTRSFAAKPNRFVQVSAKMGRTAIIVPRVTSEN